MKLYKRSSIVVALAFAANLYGFTIPDDLQEIMRRPPSVSEGYEKGFTLPLGKGVLISGPEFVSFIELQEDVSSAECTYTFRTFSRKHKLEITGGGRVFENYYRIRNPRAAAHETIVFDKGSVLEIDAGMFKIQWSSGRHLYLAPKDMTIEASSGEAYNNAVNASGR